MSDLDINDTVLAELRSAADIVEVIGEHTRLKKAGRSWKGLCPFHNERTPSFTVDRDKGLYHCFGCGAGGDAIHFVRQMDRLDFLEAVESLASRFGVAIPRRPSRGPRDDRREQLFEALSAAHRFWVGQLAKPGSRAAEYLKERGVSEDLSRKLNLGHAPESWDSLSKTLLPAFPESLLVEAGLLQQRPESKGSYDRFRDRLLFVVRDERGRPVGFGGRALSPGTEPKYLNSPESPVFSKKRLLYGLSEAREAIRSHERAVLVEGYFDHLAFVAAGVEETIASMGTALTAEQAEKLKRLSPRIVVCYDGDAAGRAATRSALALLLAQGLQVQVARLPDGEDPHDALRREGPAHLASRIEEAPDAITWLLEDAKPLEPGLSAAEKSNRISGILEVMRSIPDTVLRHEECRRVSRHVSVPLELLWERIRDKSGGSSVKNLQGMTGTPGNSAVLSHAGMPAVERWLVQALMGDAEHNSLILGTLKDEHLTHPLARRLVQAFRQAESPSETIDFQRQIAHLTEEERALIPAIALEESSAPTRKRVEQLLKELEKKYLDREGAEVQEEIERAVAAGNRTAGELLRRKDEIAKQRQALGRGAGGKGTKLGD